MKRAYISASVAAAFAAVGAAFLAPPNIFAVSGASNEEIFPLSQVPVPDVPGIDQFVQNKDAAIVLGKALFWDSQAGSDGQACASCHFHAGADSRLKNQLNPGAKQQPQPDGTFQVPATGLGPNYTLQASDFPFHRLADPNDRNSAVTFTTNDVVSSQGTQDGRFNSLMAGSGVESCDLRALDVFHVGTKLTRKVEPRNTPSVINAVFNFDNFWDGRADNVFNGVNPRGPGNAPDTILKMTGPSTFAKITVALANSSAASQADGPPTNDTEMSCAGKAFKVLGRKLLNNNVMPLQNQDVRTDDSRLGAFSNAPGKGLKVSYVTLIQAAFRPEFTDNVTKLDANGNMDVNGFTQMEHNFSLFWGLAIQLYESTLLANDTPLDRHLAGIARLPRDQKRGFGIFTGKGNCIKCHAGAELTDASVRLRNVVQSASGETGFHFIGNRPADRDIGRNEFNPAVVPGAMKTPGLRNVALTQPYFSNGGTLTLEQVVQQYSRGQNLPDGTPNVDKEIKKIGLDAQDQKELVAFLRFALTDKRVACEKAPFDHPSLRVANGHKGDNVAVTDANNDGKADDDPLDLPAVGSGGLPAIGMACLKNDDGSANTPN